MWENPGKQELAGADLFAGDLFIDAVALSRPEQVAGRKACTGDDLGNLKYAQDEV